MVYYADRSGQEIREGGWKGRKHSIFVFGTAAGMEGQVTQ